MELISTNFGMLSYILTFNGKVTGHGLAKIWYVSGKVELYAGIGPIM